MARHRRHVQGDMQHPGEPSISDDRTQRGLRRRVLEDHGRDIRYVNKWGIWLKWNGSWWRDAEPHEIMAMIDYTARDVWTEIMVGDKTRDEKDELKKFAERSAGARWQKDVLSMIAGDSEQRCCIDHDQLDTHPHLLACHGTTVDLRTGQLMAPNRDHLITRGVDLPYKPKSSRNEWINFYEQITCGNEHMMDFLHRVLGYMITGETREQAYFIFKGGGSNGKSLLIDTITGVIGKLLCQSLSPRMLTASWDGEKHPEQYAALYGARMAISDDKEQAGRKLDTGKIKMLMSKWIRCRRMRENSWEYVPTHKLVLLLNDMPAMDANDMGSLRRPIVIPFKRHFWTARTLKLQGREEPPNGETMADLRLDVKLQSESLGILTWLVQGAVNYYKHGLSDLPGDVESAATEIVYFTDTVQRWIEARTTRGNESCLQVDEAYISYRDFCRGVGNWNMLSVGTFTQDMCSKGYVIERAHFWGLQLKDTRPTKTGLFGASA